MLEVLSPAGSSDALVAAVQNGADAVYLGCGSFNARVNAKNFTLEQLHQWVSYCHIRGVKVYLTLNTLVLDRELKDVAREILEASRAGVDAILVQDLGVCQLVRTLAPDVPIHASTQMAVHNLDGVLRAAEMGITRVVLARELSHDQIAYICKHSPIEVEVFVHGALCMSVSGQCLFSALLGGRSGNRGLCAQPCRLPFAAPGGTGHDLSLKDLSFVREIGQLKQAGVCSAKIEGRMKRPEYVAAAVSACRRAADGEEVPQALLDQLEAVFSRSGFTQGYLTGERGRAMFGVRRKEDVTQATEKVFASLRGLYRGENQRVSVFLDLKVQGEALLLTARDGEGRRAVSTAPLGEGLSLLPQERCVQQLQKTGGTPFRAESVQVPQAGVPCGVSTLNALRREALDTLLRLREEREPIPFQRMPLSFSAHSSRQGELPLRAQFRLVSQVCPQAKRCREIVLPLETPLAQLERLREQGYPSVFLDIPRALFGEENRTVRKMEQCVQAGFDQFLCGNLGAVALARQLGAGVHGSFGLNIYNTASLEFFRTLGLSTAELSLELTAREVSQLGDSLPRGLMVYGRQPMMLVRNCPLANSPKGCLHCKEPGCLTDRKRKEFPVVCRGGKNIEVLNSVPLWLCDLGRELAPVDFGVARFTVENSVECGDILDACFQGNPPGFDYTRGLFHRGVE